LQPLQGIRYQRVDLTESGSLHPSNKKTFESLREDITYSHEIPYSIVLQRFKEFSIIPLHFADTIEILIVQNIAGYIYVAGKNYLLDGSPKVIIILPEMLHSAEYRPIGEGTVLNLKLSLKDMRVCLDLEGILASNGHSINSLHASQPDYKAIYKAVMSMAKADDNYFVRMGWMLKIYELLIKGIPDNLPEVTAITSDQHKINDLLCWTEEHYKENISVESAAEYMNLSKYYFCRFFKKETGITYITFLNQVRVRHAFTLLLSGKSMTECCYECGFTNMPYFVQLFKKTTGYTSHKYLKQYQKGKYLE